MYLPASFSIDDPERLGAFLAQNSFATLITQEESGFPFASHIPLLYEPTPGAGGRLLGHLARANPQSDHLALQRPVLAIFHGPHAYISPRWYVSAPAVPTWNYAVVHAHGTPNIFDKIEDLDNLVRRMTHFYEGIHRDSAPYDLPSDFMAKQLKGIVGFEIKITSLSGKFKLGQNRPSADREGVFAALSQSSRPEDQQMASFMKDAGVLD
jgi:transcriptional regulator